MSIKDADPALKRTAMLGKPFKKRAFIFMKGTSARNLGFLKPASCFGSRLLIHFQQCGRPPKPFLANWKPTGLLALRFSSHLEAFRIMSCHLEASRPFPKISGCWKLEASQIIPTLRQFLAVFHAQSLSALYACQALFHHLEACLFWLPGLRDKLCRIVRTIPNPRTQKPQTNSSQLLFGKMP